MRVVFLEDGETVHNVFSDRWFMGDGMKIRYYQETDSLYIELSSKASVDSNEVAHGVVLDMDGEGHLVGIDVEYASKNVDLTRLEAESLPFVLVSVA